jgi:hypothetical protein
MPRHFPFAATVAAVAAVFAIRVGVALAEPPRSATDGAP